MAIANIGPWVEVEVDVTESLNSIAFWLDGQKLEIAEDYRWSGVNKKFSLFAFKDRDKAMLFKLTFGGK